MASKSRRVASRQSQLNRRRKKQQRGPSGIPTEIPTPVPGPANAPNGSGASGEPAGAAVADSSPSPRPMTQASSAQTATPLRSSPRIRDERPAAYQYMAPEIRRIIAMAATAFAVLLTINFVL